MNIHRAVFILCAIGGLWGGIAHAQIDKRIAQRSIPSAGQVHTLDMRSNMGVDEAGRLTRRSEFSNAEMQMLAVRSEFSAANMQVLNKRSEPGEHQAAHLRRYTDVRGMTGRSVVTIQWLQIVRSRSVD